MHEGERIAWYKVAILAIGDIPLSILERATVAARKACDHPAKIVPFICKFEPETVRLANENLRHARARYENLSAPRIEKQEPEYITAQELSELRVELASGLSA